MNRGDFHLFFVFLLFNVVERQYKKKRIRDMDENNVPEMRPTFEEIRKVDGDGKEYWSSRELCNAMGYSGYWKFQNVIDKAIKVASEKGMNIDEHFNHVVEMVKLGSGSFRKVEAFHLSRMACMIISENADSRKLLVKQARAYFSQSVSTTELMRNSLESNILLYKTAQGETRIEVIFNNETFWMSQKRMAALFGVDVRTISYHIGQIYETGELDKMATIRKIGIVQTEGERDVERAPLFYNLDVIIAVGYRVNSYQATQFRIWATSIYAECSADYDAKAESTKLFYKMVQNMMHLAVTNHTAAEIVYEGADAEMPHIGLTTWKKAPEGRVQKSDTIVAKNYLSDEELSQLNAITASFLDLAESRARRHIVTTMEDWKNRLKLLLETMDYDAKSSAGKVSQEEAREKAYSEYEKYKVIQDRSYISDFDRFNSGNDDDTPLLPFDIDPKE